MPRRDGLRFEDFKNHVSWVPTMVLRSWGPTRQLRIWDWTMQADNWASAIGAENGVLCHRVEFSTVATAVKFFWSRQAKMNWEQTPRDVPNVVGVVSIVWLRKTFKNYLSPRVDELKSEVNKTFVPEQQSPPAFVFACICFCIHICIAIQH